MTNDKIRWIAEGVLDQLDEHWTTKEAMRALPPKARLSLMLDLSRAIDRRLHDLEPRKG